MTNTHAIFIDETEYTATQFFDVDTDESGVDITDAMTGEHICEITDENIPDVYGDEEGTLEFEKRVIAAIQEAEK